MAALKFEDERIYSPLKCLMQIFLTVGWHRGGIAPSFRTQTRYIKPDFSPNIHWVTALLEIRSACCVVCLCRTCRRQLQWKMRKSREKILQLLIEIAYTSTTTKFSARSEPGNFDCFGLEDSPKLARPEPDQISICVFPSVVPSGAVHSGHDSTAWNFEAWFWASAWQWNTSESSSWIVSLKNYAGCLLLNIIPF